MMGLAAVIDSLGQQEVITVTQRAAGSYVNGEYAPGSTSDTDMDAVVFPAQHEDLKRLPGGRRTEDVLVLVTKAELRTAQAASNDADRVTYGGQVFEVEKVEDFSAVAGYWHALAVRVQ